MPACPRRWGGPRRVPVAAGEQRHVLAQVRELGPVRYDERMAGGWQSVHDEPFCLFYLTVFLMS